MAGMVVRERRVVEVRTVDDLDAMPDDGVQRELLDGLLLVTPSPILIHQAVVGELHLALRHACPDHLKVLFAPLDWRPDQLTSLQPDLLVLPRDRLEVTNVTLPDLELAVEVLSPSTPAPGTRRSSRSTASTAVSSRSAARWATSGSASRGRSSSRFSRPTSPACSAPERVPAGGRQPIACTGAGRAMPEPSRRGSLGGRVSG